MNEMSDYKSDKDVSKKKNTIKDFGSPYFLAKYMMSKWNKQLNER